jgi:hypothetical protein
MPSEFKITMLGPGGVGKTSLLTAMYDRFDATLDAMNLQFVPDSETAAILTEKLGQLKSLTDEFEATGGLEKTENTNSFRFGIGMPGKKSFLKLQFIDYPGEFMHSDSTKEEKKWVEDSIAESVAVLVAIDAPVLMEGKGKWHELINRPTQIKILFQNVFQNLQTPKLVIFAPVKCEKYLRSESESEQLIKRIREDKDYQRLFKLFDSESLKDKIVSVITPVQTVGSVVFSRIEEKEKKPYPYFYFRKISHDAMYSPQDCEQPLLYLLRFILNLEMKNRKESWFLLGFLREWLNLDEDLAKSLQKAIIQNNQNQNSQSIVVQGQNWLEL